MGPQQWHPQPRQLRLVTVVILALACARGAVAADYAAATNGIWSDAATWAPSGGPPGANDYAYIGTINSTEMGAASYASVALSASQAVDNLVLGYGTATGGTLNLAGFPLTVGSTIFLGQPGVGIGVIEHNGGYFNTQYLEIFNGNSLVMAASDSVTAGIAIYQGSQLTTGASINFYSAPAVSVFTGSTLTLSTSLSMAGTLDIEQSSTLNMGGYNMSVNIVDIGLNDLQTVSVTNRGTITTPHLNVAANTFNLIPADVVTDLSLTNTGQMTTASIGNITSQATVDSDSTLTLGASMSLPGTLDVERGSTLNMASHGLYAVTVDLGYIDSQPVSVINRGPITTPYLNVGASAFNLVPSDAVQYFALSNTASTLFPSGVSVTSLSLNNSSSATTSAANNVISYVTVSGSSTLTLGSSMSINGTLDLEQSSTLNMAGFPLSATTVDIGYNYLQPVSVVNRGTIAAAYLQVAAQPFNLVPGDVISYLSLSSSAQMTTAATGNLLSNVSLATSSMLTLGDSMSLNGTLDVENSSTLNMANHGLSAVTVNLGWNYGSAVTVLNRGPITATYLQVAASRFDLSGSDQVTDFDLEDNAATLLSSSVSVATISLATGSQGTTSVAGNVTSSVAVATSAALILGSSMSLGSTLDLEQDATLNMMGHPLHALTVDIGFNYAQAVNVTNRGAITASYLQVAGQPFNLIASDVVTNLTLQNSGQLTTAASGNVTSAATLQNSSTLTLGAPMALNGSLDVEQSSTLNMAGQPLNVPVADFGVNNLRPVNVVDAGTLTANYVYDSGGGSGVVLAAPNSVINTEITVSNNSVMTIQQPVGQLTGLTFHGSSSAALALNDTSVLELSGGSNSGPSWIFRWQDPTVGSWVNTLTGDIAAGRMAVSSTSGYSLFDLEGYTYVATPSTLIWNGGGAGNNWSTSGNWGSATPAAGHWLAFGPLAPGGHAANSNDLAANSLFYGIFFDSGAPSYDLQGNAIDLTGDVLNQSGTNQTIGLNIQFVTGNGVFDEGRFDTGGFTVTDYGSISGSGIQLVKVGSGTLVLSGSNTYSGGTDVADGKLIVAASDALLDGSNLFVGANAVSAFGTVAPAEVSAPAASSLPAPVPEPRTWAILAAALGSAAAAKTFGRGRRRTKVA